MDSTSFLTVIEDWSAVTAQEPLVGRSSEERPGSPAPTNSNVRILCERAFWGRSRLRFHLASPTILQSSIPSRVAEYRLLQSSATRPQRPWDAGVPSFAARRSVLSFLCRRRRSDPQPLHSPWPDGVYGGPRQKGSQALGPQMHSVAPPHHRPTLCRCRRPRSAREGQPHSSKPRSIERAVGIPAHDRTVKARTKVVDRTSVEQCTLDDQNQVRLSIVRQHIDPSAELPAKLDSEHRLPKGSRREPRRTPRTPVEHVDDASGDPKCSDQRVAESGLGRFSHDHDSGHACHLPSTAATAVSMPWAVTAIPYSAERRWAAARRSLRAPGWLPSAMARASAPISPVACTQPTPRAATRSGAQPTVSDTMVQHRRPWPR